MTSSREEMPAMTEQILPAINPTRSTQPMKKTLDLVLKRLFDILAAALGLLLLAPLFALVAWLIKRDSPGPAFYRGPRLGQGGKEFGILKFRILYERPQRYAGPRITGKGDSRVTPIGRWRGCKAAL
jgi:lipopolysaccharide/colanic/teichoic acid biosynthesis glycosyltransferase